jgi:hypothetical protein
MDKIENCKPEMYNYRPMTHEHSQFMERGPRQDKLVITPQAMWDANHSQDAIDKRERIDEKERKGELDAVLGCSDARTWTSGDISIRNIAGAVEPPLAIARDRSIRIWNTDAHFDSFRFSPGHTPIGCGGLGAKEGIGNTRIETPGVGRYVSEQVAHTDPLIQAIRTGENTAALSGKPVLVTAQDHRTLRVIPVALFESEDGEERIRSAVPRRYLNPENYDPRIIYANGIPQLREDSLPDSVLELLERNRREAREAISLYPDLVQMLEVQQPRMVWVTSNRRNARATVPGMIVPGSLFKVSLPFEKEMGTVRYNPRDVDRALVDQISYPISHAVQNHGEPNKPFSNTDRLIIETPDMEQSLRLATRALRERQVREWHALEGHEIFVLQTNDGVINDIKELEKAA